MANHRTSAFEAGKSLRHLPVQFVSAGHLEGTIKEHIFAVENNSLKPSSSPSSSTLPQDHALDNTDAMAHMAIRSPSPVPSDLSSSADEVVFTGRSKIPPAPETTASAQLPTTHNADSDADSVVHDQFVERRHGRPPWEGLTTQWQHRSKPHVGWLPARNSPDMDAFLPDVSDARNAAIVDYMQNVDEFGLTGDVIAASGFLRREMDLDTGGYNDWESASGSQDEGEDEDDEKGDDGQGMDDWDSDMIQDFADISTSSDVIDTVIRILAKRIRKSGLHYLCIYEGSIADDARWLPSTFLKSPAEKQLIRVFEDDVLFREQQQGNSNSNSTEGGEGEEEEEVDDETIARVLQKQEELGLGSDEILLYTGDEFFDGRLITRTSAADIDRPNKKRHARRSNRELTFPSASAMADALALDPYNGFDIMDTERPSLKPKKRGRRGHLPPEIEDADLNEELQNAWEADRSKKRLKKVEREDLRQKGLLGRKGKAPDLKVKYQGGIEMQDAVEEIRDFLFGCSQSLALPPMDAHHRAIIHQASRYFDLTSRSRGDGLNRFTVLSKTSRTRTWTDDEFDAVIQRKGFIKRLKAPLRHQGCTHSNKSDMLRNGGARVRTRTGYRDGEMVGANAPELGPENKGHVLMMKMGWSKGMGLGALDNKGILQPISHTVKTNKAGLQ